jgi:hypothetical protein
MDIQHGDRARIKDFRFQNVRIEVDDWNPRPVFQSHRDEKYQADPADGYCPKLLEIRVARTGWSQDSQRGTVRNVVLKDITVTGKPFPTSFLQGFDAQHTVEGVTIERLRVNGRLITNSVEARFSVGPYVKDLRFVP